MGVIYLTGLTERVMLDGCRAAPRDVSEKFEFETQIAPLDKADLL